MEDVKQLSLAFIGAGNVTVNGRALETYFALDALRYIVNQPFEVTSTLGQFDVKVTVIGGGIKGQAEAIRLGIARALSELDREAYRSALKAAGMGSCRAAEKVGDRTRLRYSALKKRGPDTGDSLKRTKTNNDTHNVTYKFPGIA